MYDISKVNTALTGLVGWKQPINPDFAIVDADNLASTSNRFFTDNEFVKISLLKSTQDYVSISDVEFNAFLTDLYRKSVVDVLDKVFNESDFIDRQLLYKRTNNKVNVDTLPDGFVGYQLEPSLQNNYAFEITRVLLEFQNVGTDLTLLLYNSAKKQPIETKVITITSEQQEEILNWVLDDTDSFYRGEYYLGYRTAGVTLQPIRREFESADIESVIEGMYVTPISVVQPDINLFDLEDIDNESETWGINPDISVYKDYTDLIIQNKRLFAPAIQYQGQIKAIEVYLASIRSNRNERISNDNVKNMLVELEGINSQGLNKTGLRSFLENEITRAKAEIDKLINGYSDQNQIVSVTRC